MAKIKKPKKLEDEEKEKLFCLAWLCENVLKLEGENFMVQADEALRTIGVTLLSIASGIDEEDAKAMLAPGGGNA